MVAALITGEVEAAATLDVLGHPAASRAAGENRQRACCRLPNIRDGKEDQDSDGRRGVALERHELKQMNGGNEVSGLSLIGAVLRFVP